MDEVRARSANRDRRHETSGAEVGSPNGWIRIVWYLTLVVPAAALSRSTVFTEFPLLPAFSAIAGLNAAFLAVVNGRRARAGWLALIAAATTVAVTVTVAPAAPTGLPAAAAVTEAAVFAVVLWIRASRQERRRVRDDESARLVHPATGSPTGTRPAPASGHLRLEPGRYGLVPDVLAAAAIAAAVGAAVVAVIAAASGAVPPGSVSRLVAAGQLAAVRAGASLTGIAAVVPLVWAAPSLARRWHGRPFGAVAASAAAVGLTVHLGFVASGATFVWPYLPLAVLLFAVLRGGSPAAVALPALWAPATIWYAQAGHGPWAEEATSLLHPVLGSQLYNLTAIVTAWGVAALVHDRERAYRELAEANETLEARVAARTAELEAEVAGRLEAEARYRSLFTESASVMLVIDPAAGEIVDANAAAARYYGWALERLRGMRITEINTLPPDRTRTEMGRASRPVGDRFEFRHRRAGGDVRDVEVYSGPVADGDRTLLYSIVHDITDAKRAEVELRAHAERTAVRAELSRALAATEPDPAAVLDEALRLLVTHVGDLGVVMLREPETPQLRLAALDARDPDALALYRAANADHPRRIDEPGPIGELFATGDPVVLHDLDPDELGSVLPANIGSYLDRYGARSVVYLPLTTGETAAGLLAFARFATSEPYTDHDVALLRDLAERVGVMFERAETATRLRASEERFRTAFDDAPVGMVEISVEPDDLGRYRNVNQAFCDMVGRTRDELVGSDLLTITHPDECGRDRDLLAGLSDGSGRLTQHDKRYVHRDGRTVWAHLNISMLTDRDGRRYLLEHIEDVTERRRNRELTDVMFEVSADLLCTADFDGYFTRVNPAWERTLGWSAEELTAVPFTELVHPDDRARTVQAMGALAHGGPVVGFENRYRHRDGTYRWLQWNSVPMHEQCLAMASARDVTASKQAEAELVQRALYDPLTGLANRQLLHDRLRLALYQLDRRPGTVALCYLDLDRFKDVNDSLGHEAGDRVLVEVARRLGASVRAVDTVARLAGDEFVLICPDLDERRIGLVANRILAALSEPIDAGERIEMGASIGVAIARDGSTPADELLRRADTAMYHAKHRGRNRWELFSDALQHRSRERLAVQHDLPDALDHERFQLRYQPIIDLTGGRIVGDRFGPLEIAVNLSGRQLAQATVVDSILATLAITGLDPARLCIEMTGRVLVNADRATVEDLRRLTEHGVHLAIDDFGTGYSSLTHLKQFPVDTVKIDRSFVADLGRDPEDTAIVEAIATLARNLDLTTVAEGVETHPQLHHLRGLRGLHCQRAQGFLLHRPVAANDVTQLLEARTGIF